MELNERIVIDYGQICDVVRQVLEEMRELRADSFVRRILSAKDMEAVRRWESLLQRRLDEPFSIVVMGDFKRGKSTFINAILGKQVVPSNVTPETVTINRIFYGEEAGREAVLKNGMRIRLEDEELGRAQLERLMERLPAPIDYIDVREPLETLREISIVDTPGMGDVLNQFDAQVHDYIARADAVIYIASALSPLSESEQMFLSGILRPQSFSRLFLVVNMADCLETAEDIQRVKALILERVQAVSMNAAVFAVSALDELCRKLGKKRPNPELTEALEDGFRSFETAMRDDILLQKEAIQSQRLVSISREMVSDVRNRIELIGKMLGVKKSELQQMEQQCHTDMANIDKRLQKSTEGLERLTRQLCREARGWMEEFLDRMRQELNSLGSSQPTTVLQKHLQFYLSDHIRQAVLACLGAHRPQIENALREYAKEFSHESLNVGGEGRIQDISIQLADISWTSVDTASFAVNTGAEILLGTDNQLYGIISGVSMIMGGFVRESQMKSRQADLLQPLLKKFPDIRQDVAAQLETAYNQMSKAACARLAELFRSQLDASLEALGQAQKVLQNEDVREEELTGQLAVAKEMLDRADRLLDSTGIASEFAEEAAGQTEEPAEEAAAASAADAAE